MFFLLLYIINNRRGALYEAGGRELVLAADGGKGYSIVNG